MPEPIVTAGLAPAAPEPTENPRRQLIKGIRAVLRNTNATEAEDVDALEALLELSKE
jgi:hypothetical protein